MTDATLETTPAEKIKAFANKHGLTIECVFVPFSRSRHKGAKSPSLNWNVAVFRNGRQFMSIEYSQGCAHCPAYKAKWENKGRKAEAITIECETGKQAKTVFGYKPTQGSKPISPPTIDAILWCLSMDASVLDYATYEQWAPDLGFDLDSRKGEAIYRQCLSQALALRSGIGDAGLRELADAAQDY